MENKNDILSTLKLRQKLELPVGFFANFADNLMDEIEVENGILGQLKKAEKPSLPAGFFDDFEIEQPTLNTLIKAEKPAVPNGFFETFEAKIGRATEQKTFKKGRILPMSALLWVGSVAALFIAFFTVYQFWGTPTQLENNSSTLIAATVNETSFDTYSTYLQEDDIIDFIVDNEIEITESRTVEISEETYDLFSEEDLEDFYLEL